VIYGVLQLIVISAVVVGDRLPCSVSYCILVCGYESWTLVTAEHITSAKDLHDCLVLLSSRVWNSLDSELWHSGDSELWWSWDLGYISKDLDLVGVAVHFFLFDITQRSVIFIIFTFSLVAFFFFFLIVFFFLMIIVVVMQQLLSFTSVFSYWYRDHYLEGILLLRNMLKRVGLWLWLR
jgi:hypothetical protein